MISHLETSKQYKLRVVLLLLLVLLAVVVVAVVVVMVGAVVVVVVADVYDCAYGSQSSTVSFFHVLLFILFFETDFLNELGDSLFWLHPLVSDSRLCLSLPYPAAGVTGIHHHA